jgi:hypothetical protein
MEEEKKESIFTSTSKYQEDYNKNFKEQMKDLVKREVPMMILFTIPKILESNRHL